MTKAEKNKKISESGKLTREKRKVQVCKVFEAKLDKSHFNKTTKEDIIRVFLEAKWYRNFVIAEDNIFNASDKLEKVQVKVGDKFEEREVKILSSQMKQGVVGQIRQDIINLSKKKKKGEKFGKLKFKSRCDSINLPQFACEKNNNNGTYRIKGNKVKIQGIKQWIRVIGLWQFLKDEYELANAKLIQKPSGYYLKITCYIDKNKYAKILIDKEERLNLKYGEVKKVQGGGDFGILNPLTLSNGIALKYNPPVATKKLKRLARRGSNKKLNSKNRYKSTIQIAKEYEKSNNIKKDISNKIVNIIKTEYELFGWQDDNLKGWQRIWGKRMLNTAIGGITSGLKKSSTAIKVGRFEPTTKECPICNHKNNITLKERIFCCSNCGYTKPRDVKSAEDIRDRAIKKIGAERIELTTEEMQTSTNRILNRLKSIPRVEASLVDESVSQIIHNMVAHFCSSN